ncbi:pyridoxamine 5'-phosphate oxidase family protein [Kribbella sp. NPDC050124]|uniref:pyridoxamine 5'-phosphate oxidase family protein n=1 Tax=Kribbella sp. NPDC050124 TaxID=3364114 RepID=UPI0037A8566C
MTDVSFDDAVLEVLDQHECLRLLRTVPLGRLVFSEAGLPAVRLVNFFIDGDSLVFLTAEGNKLRAAERGDVVAFEADDVDTDRRHGWTVTAVGRLSVVPANEHAEVHRRLPVQSWVARTDAQLIRLGLGRITGRRLTAH